jgi:hypothetical protein
VVKANNGAGGLGTVVLPSSTPQQRVGSILTVSARMFPPLAQGPLVVEELIRKGLGRATEVSVCGLLDATGGTAVHGQSRFASTRGGRYLGAVAGRGAVGSDIRDRLNVIAAAAGRLAHEYGYAGPFGVDALVDGTDRLRCTELNVRRTLATHLYDIGTRLAGPGWAQVIALASADHVESGLPYESYGELRDALSALWYPISGAKRGIFVASMNPMGFHAGREVGLVAIGEEASDASELLRAAHSALRARIEPGLDELFPAETLR